MKRFRYPLVVLFASGVFACDSSSPSAAVLFKLSDRCSLASDCESTLTCVFGRCHVACNGNAEGASRDCGEGGLCVAGESGRVCQLPVERACKSHADCPAKQVCAVDGVCRDGCASDLDCAVGDACVRSVCAVTSDVRAISEIATSSVGAACKHASDCPDDLVCLGASQRDGQRERGSSFVCDYECLSDRDCLSGFSCLKTRCGPTPPIAVLCADGSKNGTESDVDCGGACTAKCALGKRCNLGGDCVNGVCTAGICGTGMGALSVTAGSHHSCARTADGRVKCWGGGLLGELGQDRSLDWGDMAAQMGAALPFTFLGVGRTALKIAAGYNATCALLDDGTVKCWGLGPLTDPSMLGASMGDMATLPTIALGESATDVVMGGDPAACALLASGNVRCWGTAPVEPPVDLGGQRAVKLAAGNTHACALVAGGKVKCWGGNTFAQLGLGDTMGRGSILVPDRTPEGVDLGAGRTVTQLAVGGDSNCVLLDTQELKCWGANYQGQLGIESTITHIGGSLSEMGSALQAVDLGLGASTISQIGAGGGASGSSGSNRSSMCAITSEGRVKCWGDNAFGKLGQGRANGEVGRFPGEMGINLPFTDLPSTLRAAQISIGEVHSCVVFVDGKIKCWGSNGYGRLGLGDTQDRGNDPMHMAASLPFVSIR